MSRSDREGLTRRAKTASTFKQFFSSPSLVFELGESFVIEMHIPAQGFRKEQLETEITIVRHLQPKAGDPAFLDFVQKMTGWIPALRARMTGIKNSHEQNRGKCIPSPDGGVRGGTSRRENKQSLQGREKNFLMSKANLEIQERVLHPVDKIATHPLLSLRDILSTGEVGGELC